MTVPDGCMSVSGAAVALGCSASNVRLMFYDGKLAGTRGDQPTRRRIYIRCDEGGHPLDPSGAPVGVGTSLQARLDALERRVEAIENRDGTAVEAERLRDAALLMNGVIEHQRRASELQAEAARESGEALSEQSSIISALLVGDPNRIIGADPSRLPVPPRSQGP